jgi:hypothetical protein
MNYVLGQNRSLVETRYQMGDPWVGKNTRPVPMSFQVGYRWHPQVVNRTHTHPRRGGYPIPIPELPSLTRLKLTPHLRPLSSLSWSSSWPP